jgi:tRNA(Ile)-lysidine synthase
LDSSNLDRRFLRNRIRLELLPLLEKDFNPALRRTIGQNMDILAQEDDLLEELSASAYNQCVERSEVLIRQETRPRLFVKKEPILALHPAIQRRIMEKSCWQMGIRPTYEQICTLAECMARGKNGSELHLEDGVRVEKTSHGLYFSRPLPKALRRGAVPPAAGINLAIPGPGTYPVNGTGKKLVIKEISAAATTIHQPGELRLDSALISFPLLLRSFQPGELFQPYGSPGKKKISRYLNERKIPAKERAAWPVLLSGNRVVALVGLELDHNFRIANSAGKILSVCWQDCKE